MMTPQKNPSNCLSNEEDQQDPQCMPLTHVYKRPSLTECMFNIKYNLMHSDIVQIPYFHRKKITLNTDSQPAYLLGSCYQFPHEKQFVDHIRSIVWMSYRSISNGKGDAGWGCMIRVVQMLLIELLRRNNPSAQVDDIISLFKQGKQHIFSLDNICAFGHIKQRLAGSNEILLAASSIFKAINSKQNPLEVSTSKLNILSLNIKLQIYCEKYPMNNPNFSSNINPSVNQEFPKLIVISTKIKEQGSTNFPQIYVDHAKHLMSRMPSFCGAISGVSKQALYIVGYQDNYVICLDPHYVQDEGQPDKIKYHKKTPRGLPFNELCQTISLCFYLPDPAAYFIWAAELCHSCKLYAPYLVARLEAEGQQEIIEKYRKRSEDFQML